MKILQYPFSKGNDHGDQIFVLLFLFIYNSKCPKFYGENLFQIIPLNSIKGYLI